MGFIIGFIIGFLLGWFLTTLLFISKDGEK